MRQLAFSLALACIVATVSPMRAQAQETGSVTVFYSPSSSDLEVPSLTGKPSFTNDGHYGGGFGDVLLVDRVGVTGGVLFGATNTIPGGADFTSPTFNPTTHEIARILDVAGTFALVKTGSARVDATAGYFYLYAKPEISEANSYGGPALGFRTKYIWSNGLDVHGNLSIVPTFFVHGNVEGVLLAESIVVYRFGADYAIAEHLAVSAGYQGSN